MAFSAFESQNTKKSFLDNRASPEPQLTPFHVFIKCFNAVLNFHFILLICQTEIWIERKRLHKLWFLMESNFLLAPIQSFLISQESHFIR